jgi:hypothetical protein
MSEKITNLDEFEIWFRSLHPTQKRIFWCCHRLIVHFKGNCFASQSKIALLAKACRQYVNKVIERFSAFGVLIKTYRHHETCIYNLPEWLKIADLKNVLKQRFSLWGGDTVTTQVLDIPTESLSRYSDDQKQVILNMFPDHLKKLASQDIYKALDFVGFGQREYDLACESFYGFQQNYGIPSNPWAYMYKKCKENADKLKTFNPKNWAIKYKIQKTIGL